MLKASHAEASPKISAHWTCPLVINAWLTLEFPNESSHFHLKNLGFPIYLNKSTSGWWFQPSWKIWVCQWEGWYPIYEMDNQSNVPNHQTDIKFCETHHNKIRSCKITMNNQQLRSSPVKNPNHQPVLFPFYIPHWFDQQNASVFQKLVRTSHKFNDSWNGQTMPSKKWWLITFSHQIYGCNMM